MIPDTEPNGREGTVLQVQRMSTEDGPGIRTTVFFKGCTLRCAWCHNPESISSKPQVQWVESRCIGCGACVEACPKEALTPTPGGIIIDRDQCDSCGECAAECPSTAMELLGVSWGLDHLVNEVEKDRPYFEASGGGITASGGEPTVQAEFVAAFLQGCRERGMKTALDTCGKCSGEALDMILPWADLALFDVKEIDPLKHKEFTGSGNSGILRKLGYLCDRMRVNGIPDELWIRTPIIPDATATEENIRGIGAYISDNLGDVVSRWELCSFNNLCNDKYVRLGVTWPYRDYPLVTDEVMEALVDVAGNSGVDSSIVHWRGLTGLKMDG